MRTFKVYFRNNGKIDNCWVTAANAAEAAGARAGVVKVVVARYRKFSDKVVSYTFTFLTR